MQIMALAPKSDFPILQRTIAGRPLVYLDSAATSLKPQCVIDAVARFYTHNTANVSRAFHTLAQEATEQLTAARTAIARFIGARVSEIAFTSGTTEGANLVAWGLGLAAGDNVITSVAEHHSNLLPWMRHCEVRLLPFDAAGRVDVGALAAKIDGRTRLVALSAVSNVTGAIHPIREAIAIAQQRGVPVFVDAAQSVPHLPVDVGELACDFLAFSGHKMLGPSGVGVLFVRTDARHRLAVVKLGGGAVHNVTERDFTLKQPPASFEAGTPNIEGVIGLAAAVRYLDALGMDRVAQHAATLTQRAAELLAAVPGLQIIDRSHRSYAGIISVFHDRIDADRLAMLLSDSYGVMARSGTHCAHPFFRARGIAGSLRLSMHVYTDEADLQRAAEALAEIVR